MKRISISAVPLVVTLAMLAVGWGKFTGAQPSSSGLHLTIYSSLALIEELRTLNISVGESVRTIEDLPITIVPSSVLFRPLRAGVKILEQELLPIQRQQYRQEPVLVWKVHSELEGEVQGVLSYLAGGLGWSAYYTAVLNESEDKMALSSWVRLANQSGREYRNARLTLVAGELRGVTQPALEMLAAKQDVSTGIFKEEPTFVSQPAFEYHEYKLTRPVTLKDEQTLQLSFFEADAIKVSKHYVYEATESADRVRVEIRFTNDEPNGLGVALPAGVVRLYKETNGALQLIGEDTLSHTPKNELVTLIPGVAFDLKAERVLKDHQVAGEDEDGYDIYRDTYEITLRNQKESDVVIEVKEKLSGVWKIISAKPGYEKLDANTVLFEVFVPANGTATVKYTVEWKNR